MVRWMTTVPVPLILIFFANRRGVGSGIASVCCEKGTVVEDVIQEYRIDDHN